MIFCIRVLCVTLSSTFYIKWVSGISKTERLSKLGSDGEDKGNVKARFIRGYFKKEDFSPDENDVGHSEIHKDNLHKTKEENVKIELSTYLQN